MSDATRTQYEVLGELRRTDEKIVRLQRGLDETPKELAKLDAALTERRTLFDGAKSALESSEKRLRGFESDLKDRESSIDKAAAKMMEVKTNQEYQAALKENEERKQEKTKVEEDVMKLLSEVEALRKTLKEQEKEFKVYESALLTDRKRIEEEGEKLQGLLAEQLQKRSLSAAKLDGNVASIYARVASSGAIAVALIENSVCQGCRTKVRPQLYNEILGFKAIHRCPSCGRLLICAIQDAANRSAADDLSSK